MVSHRAEEIHLFFGYALQDETFVIQLKNHLAAAYKEQIIHLWYDRTRLAGLEVEKVLTRSLKKSDIIILFISSDFMSTQDCYDIYLPLAQEQYLQQKAAVIAILLRPVDYSDTPISTFDILWEGKAVTNWKNRDQAFAEIAKRIREVAKSLLFRRLIKLGDDAFASQQYKEALRLYNKVLKLDSLDAVVHSKKGAALFELKEYRQALEAYEHALERNPNDVEAYHQKGTLLRALESPYEAVEAFERALQLAPDRADLHKEKGLALELTRDNDGALAAYERAIQLQPSDPLAQFFKGNVLQSLKRYQEALAAYNEAIYQEPTIAEFYQRRGKLFSVLKKDDDALRDYEHALELFPDALTYRYQGDTLYQLERVDEALAAFEHANQLVPENADLYAHRSFILVLLNRNEEALALINLAIRLKPISKFYRDKCTILLALNRHEEIVETGREAIRRNQADASLYSSLGLALLQLKSYRQSLVALNRAIELDPKNNELQKTREYVHNLLETDSDHDRLESDIKKRLSTKIPLGITLLIYRGHTNGIPRVAWSPNGKLLASAGMDKTAQVWNALTGSRLVTYRGHTNMIERIAWSPDGKLLASAGYDKTVQVWF